MALPQWKCEQCWSCWVKLIAIITSNHNFLTVAPFPCCCPWPWLWNTLLLPSCSTELLAQQMHYITAGSCSFSGKGHLGCVLALSNKSKASLWSGRSVTWFLSSLVKQTKLFPPSKVNPGAVQEMLLPEVKSFLSQDRARFGFFCPTQSSTSSQRAVYFETHHMFWCHILRSLSSMLCTHCSVLTDCMTAFLLFQVFKLKHLKAQTIISKRQKDGMSKWDLTAGHPTSSPTKKFFHCVAWGTGMFSRIDVVLSLTGRCN